MPVRMNGPLFNKPLDLAAGLMVMLARPEPAALRGLAEIPEVIPKFINIYVSEAEFAHARHVYKFCAVP